MTPAFLTKLRFEDDNGLPFILTDPLVYDSALLMQPVIVPAGFKTDLASIPRPLWNILPPVGRYDSAACVHDWLYQLAPFGVSRAQADAILREAMTVCGVGRVTRTVIWLGVRAGGWSPWGTYRRKDALQPPPQVAA